MNVKKIYAVDFILIVGSVLALILVIGYSRPLIIAPLDDLETRDSLVIFSIEKADEILIDDNMEFSSPERYLVMDGLEIQLSPGKYYWKASGIVDSEIRTLTINSVVDLRFVESDGFFEVVNAGNVRLSVDIYNGSEKIDSVSVGVGEEVSGGDKYVGSQEK